MATGQTLLNMMEMLNNELQLQSGEANVARGLMALNAAQDQFEARLSLWQDVLGGQTGTLTSTQQVETTAFPTGVMRIDRLQYLHPDTGYPIWDLVNVKKAGGQVFNRFWPINLVSTMAPGKPAAYWTNGRNIYWAPLPAGAYDVRWYGLQSADDITADGIFAYPDMVELPIAAFATKLLKIGVGDGPSDVSSLAEQTFDPVIRSLGSFNRDGAGQFEYRYRHDA